MIINMSLYNLPEFNISKIKKIILEIKKNKVVWTMVLAFIIFFAVGFGAGIKIKVPLIRNNTAENIYTPQISYEQAIINSVKTAAPSVVSIIITKNLG